MSSQLVSTTLHLALAIRNDIASIPQARVAFRYKPIKSRRASHIQETAVCVDYEVDVGAAQTLPIVQIVDTGA